MPNSKPANSLEMLLQRKRPAKTRSPEDTWSLDDLKNASGMHGIREFVEQAAAPVRPIEPAVEFPSPDKTVAPDQIALKSIAIKQPGDPNTPSEQPPIIATDFRAIDTIAISSNAQDLKALESVAIKSIAPEKVPHPFPGLVPPPGTANTSVDRLGNSRATNSIAIELLTPDLGEPQVDPETLRSFDLTAADYRPSLTKQFHFRPIRAIQDGLTDNEQQILSFLWNNGRSCDATDNFRACAIGDRRLGQLVDLSYMTCRNVTAALEDKLCIEIRAAVGRGAAAPKTFLVFSYVEILRRWRRAGLIYSSKRTTAIALCDGDHNVIAPKSIAPNAIAIKSTQTADSIAISSEAQEHSFIATKSRGPIRNKVIPDNKPAAPADLALVVQAITRHIGSCDELFAHRLIDACRSTAATATAEEIEYFVETTLPSLVHNSRIDSKTGVLLSRAPAAFTGESLKQLRTSLPLWRMAKANDICLHASNHTQEELQWAYSVLGEAQGSALE